MTWTYGGDPSNSTRDAVRWLVGDTDTTDQQVTDEEITFALSTASSNVHGAASQVCKGIAAKFARRASIGADGMSEQWTQLQTHYLGLAATYEADAKKGVAGISPSVVGAVMDIADNETPSHFQVGMHDQSGTHETTVEDLDP